MLKVVGHPRFLRKCNQIYSYCKKPGKHRITVPATLGVIDEVFSSFVQELVEFG